VSAKKSFWELLISSSFLLARLYNCHRHFLLLLCVLLYCVDFGRKVLLLANDNKQTRTLKRISQKYILNISSSLQKNLPPEFILSIFLGWKPWYIAHGQ
jgi:hypothetical protein